MHMYEVIFFLLTILNSQGMPIYHTGNVQSGVASLPVPHSGFIEANLSLVGHMAQCRDGEA